MESEKLDCLYRIVDRRVSLGVGEFDNPLGSNVHLYVQVYPVDKRTPKGAWINANGAKKFVLLEARKQFACNTLEEALKSFLARKSRQVRIYHTRLDDTLTARGLAETPYVIEHLKKSAEAQANRRNNLFWG